MNIEIYNYVIPDIKRLFCLFKLTNI